MNITQIKNYKKSPLIGLGAVVFFSLVIPVAVHAAPILGTASNAVSFQVSGGSLTGTETCGGPTVSGSGPVSDGCAVGDHGTGLLGYDASANASVGLGVVRASTTGHATSTTTLGTGATVNASLGDYFAISGPANSAGILSGSFVISGGLDAYVSGSPFATTAAGSSYSVQLSLNSANAARSGNITVGTNGYHEEANTGGGVYLLDAPIYFDSTGWAVLSLSMYVQLNSNGTARGYQQCSSCTLTAGDYSTGASFGNTIYWGGISSVMVNGQALTDYQLVSASGADYRVSLEPVPLPASIWLFGSGLLGLVLRIRGGKAA